MMKQYYEILIKVLKFLTDKMYYRKTKPATYSSSEQHRTASMRKTFPQAIFPLFFLVVCVTACQQKKTYYYSIDGKNKMRIEEVSDSAAYMKAFLSFQIIIKLYEDEKTFSPNILRKKPESFVLLNEQSKDITHTVQFAKKDSLEKSAIRRVKRLKNFFQDKAEKSREVN